MTDLKRLLSACLAASVILSAPGLGPVRAFAQVVSRVGAAPMAGPSLGAAAAAPVAVSYAAPSLASHLAPSLSLTLPTASPSPVISARPSAGPSPAVAAPDGVAGAYRAAAPAVLALPAAVATARPSAPVRAVPEAIAQVRSAEGPSSRVMRGIPLEGSGIAAGRLFDGSIKRAATAVAPEGTPARTDSAPARPSLLRRFAGKAATGGVVVAAVTAWNIAPQALGTAGYWLGNALAFVFPIPQIYKTFKDGGAKGTPAWRAVVGAAASLTLGLVSAPLLGQAFWGAQNTFGGLTLLAPLILGPLLARRAKGFSGKASAALTALTAALLLVPTFALYAGAAATVPDLLASLFSPQGLCRLGLGIQVATGAMFFMLFVPDIISILKGRAPKGFTSLFSLLFFITSTAFIAWTLQMASAAPANSSERFQFLVYAAQNAAYSIVSFVSWLFIRRQERR